MLCSGSKKGQKSTLVVSWCWQYIDHLNEFKKHIVDENIFLMENVEFVPPSGAGVVPSTVAFPCFILKLENYVADDSNPCFPCFPCSFIQGFTNQKAKASYSPKKGSFIQRIHQPKDSH